MGNLVIPNAILAQANISPAELRFEIAAYLYAKERLGLAQAIHLAGIGRDTFLEELQKRGIPMPATRMESSKQSTESNKPHFLSDLAGSLAGPEGDELARIVSHEFQQLEGEW